MRYVYIVYPVILSAVLDYLACVGNNHFRKIIEDA